ncbi:MAG TPA: TolC family protein, partial [Polyangiaceae bacterium]|nr:TolC family protein [Polyangiaceae bacterium]
LAEVTRVNLSAALSTLDLNRRRTSLGAGNAIDVLRADQEVQTSRLQVIEADEALRKAREALGAALGETDAWGVSSDVKLDQLRKDARDTCNDAGTVQDRADVRAARAGAAIAERNRDAVTWSFLPTVDFVSTITYNSFITNVNRKHSTWTIGGALTWHLYDGGRRYGERTLNSALWEQSKQQSIQVERDATIQVRQSIRGVEVAKRSLEVAVTTQDIAENNAQLARAKFVNGTGSSFDLVDTQRVARQSKLDVTVKEFELLQAEIIAYLALASCDI